MRKFARQFIGPTLATLLAITVSLFPALAPVQVGFENAITSHSRSNLSPDSANNSLLEKLPLHFEANRGQFNSEVKFVARSRDYSISLTASESIVQVGGNRSAEFRMKPVGGNLRSKVSGINPLISKSNYIVASDSAKSITGVPNFAAVKYEAIYPQIDLIYYGNQRQLEYDFILEPGADPHQIRVAIEGAQSIKIDSNGDLSIHTEGGEIRQTKPVIYQQRDGEQIEISGRYTLIQNLDSKLLTPDARRQTALIGFEIGDYDRSLPLVIDPVVSYSTYLGGASADEAQAVAVDAEGCAYIVGHTLSANFPTTSPLQPLFRGPASITDLFIAKLNPQGTALVYSTYLGGTGADYGLDIAVDANGRVCITGYTSSMDFPVTAGALQTEPAGSEDAFLARFNAEGDELIYSTYLGGAGFERSQAIVVDEDGNAYVTGRTTSTNFPLTEGAFQQTLRGFEDAFVAKIDESGSTLIYSTYLGGSSDFDRVNDIALDSQGNAYVTGGTASTDFPTQTASFQRAFGGGTVFFGDAFVAKLNQTGTTLVYSTYLGGAGGDEGRAVAVDAEGNAYVAGITQSADFPTHRALQSQQGGDCEDAFSNCNDAFVVKIDSVGSQLVYSTYLGGASRSLTPFAAGDSASDIAVDAAGNAYVIGTTSSDDFPTVNAIQGARAGHGDLFITSISSDGSAILYSTYFGGAGDESASGAAVDASGSVYITGIATSVGFPTTTGGFQIEFAGSFQTFALARDGFIVRIAAEIPRIISASVVRKKLFVSGENFEPGAELFINGEKQKKTFNDATNPARLLVAKKSGKKAPRGQAVTLEVRNPSGIRSAPFSFVREDPQ